MKEHICVFLAFDNVDIISRSFNSMYHESIDFFIVENPSKDSEKISEFFKDKKLVGYIKFEENIAANAINVFIKDYKELLLKYNYITITDGDFYVYDIIATINEIKCGLNEGYGIVSADLYKDNNYALGNKRIVGIDKYIEFSLNSKTNVWCVEGVTGGSLITIKSENLYFFEGIHFIDTIICEKIYGLKQKWGKTSKNLLYHLTWDLYVEGNEYYTWKKSVYPNIWGSTNKTLNYTIIT